MGQNMGQDVDVDVDGDGVEEWDNGENVCKLQIVGVAQNRQSPALQSFVRMVQNWNKSQKFRIGTKVQ